MIVSHKHRFIFLKTRKTAGTSVEMELAKIAGDDAIVTPLIPHEPDLPTHEPRNYREAGLPAEQSRIALAERLRLARENHELCRYIPFLPHMPASMVRAKLGCDVWESYFKFCFERNPWDKTISIYSWHNRNIVTPTPFNEWVLNGSASSDWSIYSIDEDCAVDAIGRYENLVTELRVLLRRVGVACGDLGLRNAKSGFRRTDVRYSPDAAERVNHVFRREISLLGYECPSSLRA